VVNLRPAAPEALRHYPFPFCFHTITTNTKTGVTARVTVRRNSLQLQVLSAVPAGDVEALIGAVLDTPLVKAARAVIDAEPRFFRARLIELAALMTRNDENEAVAQ